MYQDHLRMAYYPGLSFRPQQIARDRVISNQVRSGTCPGCRRARPGAGGTRTNDLAAVFLAHPRSRLLPTRLSARLAHAGNQRSHRALPHIPCKYPQLILKATSSKADFDGISVDDPIVFRANGRFHMLYIGFDGTGYQTGLAASDDLLHWTREALVGPRDPASPYTKYNLAISSILRDKNLHGTGEALQGGRPISRRVERPIHPPGMRKAPLSSASHAPHDLLHWSLTDPILRPTDGAAWEHGGLSIVPTCCSIAEPTTSTTTPRPILCPSPKAAAGTSRPASPPAPTSASTGCAMPVQPHPAQRLRAARLHLSRYQSDPRSSRHPTPRQPATSRFASNPYVVKNGARVRDVLLRLRLSAPRTRMRNARDW